MTSPVLLEINGKGFWATVKNRKNTKNYLYGKDGTLQYMVFDDTVKMEPFVRTKEILPLLQSMAPPLALVSLQ